MPTVTLRELDGQGLQQETANANVIVAGARGDAVMVRRLEL